MQVQVQILLMKSKIVISQGKNFKFVSTYQFDLKTQKNIMAIFLIRRMGSALLGTYDTF